MRWIRLFGPLLATCGLLWGQVTTGTIEGTVKDGTGAIVPGATMQIQNVDTGISRTVSTDSRGYYTAPNLSLGQYEVTASLTGFQTSVRRGITLNVGQNAVIDFILQVGSITQQVEVTGEAPLVETTTASVSGLVSERQVQDLPLNARNLLELAALYAGVAFAEGAGSGDARRGFATKLTIAGTRYNASLFQLDGIDINDAGGAAGSAAGILMGAETIREFNVITNGYSAEYGKHTGGVFNAVTKSGTNTLHGSAFEFLRNDKLDARNFFDNQKPAYKRNQFGASLGGPIVKDRSFFFGSYEDLRERLGQTVFFNVPSLEVRQGRLQNPSTGQVTVVPIAPGVKPFLDSYQLPNGRDFGDGTAEFIAPQQWPTDEHFFTVRLDHKLSDQDSLFGRYTFDNASRTPSTLLNTYPRSETRVQYAALGETRTFSPTVINQFLAGFSRSRLNQPQIAVKGAIFPSESFTGFTGNGIFGVMTVPGWSGWGGSTSVPAMGILNMFQYKDDVFYTKGAHSFKFGFNAQRLQDRESTYSNAGGTYTFASIPDFLQGLPTSIQALLPATFSFMTYPRQSLFGLYAQDDYRVSPRLTLNLGLRYEFVTTYVEKFNQMSNVMDVFTPGQTLANLIVGKPGFLNPSLKNFAPRLGIAWDPTGRGKTSIRAGAGIFYDQIFVMGPLSLALKNNPPIFVTGQITGRGVVRFPDAYFSQQALLGGTPKLEGLQYRMNQPTVYKYSLDLQHEVSEDTSVDLGFSGTRGVHLLRVVNMNMPVAEVRGGRLFIPTTAPLRSPAWSRIRPKVSDSSSNYDALRLTVMRRFSKNLQFTGAYTWSKAIDDASAVAGATDWNNDPGPSRYLNTKERGLAAFDIRHNFTANFTYELPGKGLAGAAGKVLGGWQMSGILAVQSGIPFTASTGVLPAYMKGTDVGDYPDIVPGNKGYTYHARNPDRYFDPSSFGVPAGYASAQQQQLGGAFIGNAGRNILTAPGLTKFDAVLVKETPLIEHVHLQFRSEFFNLFNRANFGIPAGRIFANASGAFSGSVGRITTTTTTSRQVQFGLRLVF